MTSSEAAGSGASASKPGQSTNIFYHQSASHLTHTNLSHVDKHQADELESIVRKATREEMAAAHLPLAYRDGCAHLLIPLNRCRRAEYYLPWKCEVRQVEHLYPQ